jgi:hypothetical protein
VKCKLYVLEWLVCYRYSLGVENLLWQNLNCLGFCLHRVWKKDDYWCQDQCKCYEMGQRRLSLLFMLSQVLSGLYQWNPSAKYGFLIDRILLIYMSMRLNYFVSRNSDNHLIIMYFSKWWMGELGILVSVSSNMWYKLAV